MVDAGIEKMITYNKLNIENEVYITAKAKLKLDGCYQARGIAYRVRNNRVTHYACEGEIVGNFGNYNVVLGSYEGYSDAALKALKSI